MAHPSHAPPAASTHAAPAPRIPWRFRALLASAVLPLLLVLVLGIRDGAERDAAAARIAAEGVEVLGILDYVEYAEAAAEPNPNQDPDYRSHVPVVRFELDGPQYAVIAYGKKNWKRGQRIRMRVDPGHPERAVLPDGGRSLAVTPWEHRGIVISALLAGLLATAALTVLGGNVAWRSALRAAAVPEPVRA